MMSYINVYTVTRHYGGPEEGGWWWNSGAPYTSIPVGPLYWLLERLPEAIYVPWIGKRYGDKRRRVLRRYVEVRYRIWRAITGLFAKRFGALREGDIYSVLGGTDISVALEDHKAEVWPTERPHYE